jgi:hypothetical protein
MFAALIPLLTSAFGTIIDRVVPDKAAADKAKQELASDLMRMAQESNLAQIDVNKTEAASGNLFVAGWRPGIGWVCVAALAYQFVLAPLGVWLAAIGGYDLPTPPSLDDMLWELMFGLLGMAGLRSVEKLKGVTR